MSCLPTLDAVKTWQRNRPCLRATTADPASHGVCACLAAHLRSQRRSRGRVWRTRRRTAPAARQVVSATGSLRQPPDRGLVSSSLQHQSFSHTRGRASMAVAMLAGRPTYRGEVQYHDVGVLPATPRRCGAPAVSKSETSMRGQTFMRFCRGGGLTEPCPVSSGQ